MKIIIRLIVLALVAIAVIGVAGLLEYITNIKFEFWLECVCILHVSSELSKGLIEQRKK